MSQQNSQDVESGYKRAMDFNQAMLTNPTYADESIFTTMRYAYKAKNLLRQCDYDLFMNKVGELFQISEGKPLSGEETSEERAAKVREKRQEALGCISEFPELGADFEMFYEAMRRYKLSMKK